MISHGEKVAATSAHVSLHGHPAIVSGIQQPSAMVSTLDGRYSVCYSWETVLRVISDGGRFK
jgi:hypothetical protein